MGGGCLEEKIRRGRAPGERVHADFGRRARVGVALQHACDERKEHVCLDHLPRHARAR